VELFWNGKRDSGSRAETLVSRLQSREPPAGVQVILEDSRIDISTRSAWAFATWSVSAMMIWIGLTSTNWFLLALAPFMIAAAIMQSWGRTSIVVQDERVRVFEGVGSVGRRNRVALRSITRIEYAVKNGNGGSTTWIVLHDGRREIKFGRHLNEEQIHFVIAFLLDATRSLASNAD
jgi:hypothetical protein